MIQPAGERLEQALQVGDARAAIAAVEAMGSAGYPPSLLQVLLGRCHPGLDPAFLDPALVPAALLLAPVLPAALAHQPLDARRLALCHGPDLEAFVRMDLNAVLRGEIPLYAELPALPIEAVREALWHTPPRRAWLEHLSVLECLALELAVPAGTELPSALRRWRPCGLDAALEPAWIWLERPAPGLSREQALAEAHHRAAALGFRRVRLLSGAGDAEALIAEASRLLLEGGSGRGVIWNGRGQLQAPWGEWIRGLAAQPAAPALTQLRITAQGGERQLPLWPCLESSLLAIDLGWLACRPPRQLIGLLEHWLQPDPPPLPFASSGSLAAVARPWQGLLLLAATSAQIAAHGESQLRCRAETQALCGGFARGVLVRLDVPLAEQLRVWLEQSQEPLLLAFLGPNDELLPGSWPQLGQRLAWETAELLCSDEELIWGPEPGQVGLRQLEAPPTPWRVLCRGAVPGLVAMPGAVLLELSLAPAYTSLHALQRDLALQVLRRDGEILQLPQVLLRREPRSNPAVLALAAPVQRQAFTPDQLAELAGLSRRHGPHWLTPEGALTPGRLPGTVMVRRLLQSGDRVSVLIPFRDQAALTRRCVQSLLRQRDGVPLEIVLIDNGSTEPEAIGLSREFQAQSAVPVIGVRDEQPFNFSSLNNRARRLCSGTFLLFLNNDIVFESDRVIEQLLDPFGFQGVGAVGARLLYGDGRIQHAGLMAAGGRVHDLQSPGKKMTPGPATAMVTALDVQEQWSAATGACLLVRACDFDRIGGFEEAFAVAYNDVDLCWRLAEAGLQVVVTPEPRILHLESVSRGADLKGDKRKRLYEEAGRLRARYPQRFEAADPLHHPRLSADSRRFEPAAPPPQPLHPSRDRLLWSWTRPQLEASAERPFLVYVHWDGQGRLRPDVLEQLRQYGRHCQVAFVSASPQLARDAAALAELQQLCVLVAVRHNEGYDFGSWKAALQLCWPWIEAAPRLILTNDSCYGPLVPLDELFERLGRSPADVVGLTESTLMRPHLQSFFIAYSRRLARTPIFRAFWENVGVWADKRQIVRAYEIGWSALLQHLGYTKEALYMSRYGNLAHTHWRELIEDCRFPFIKKELLQVNPLGQELTNWGALVQTRSPMLLQQLKKVRALE